MNRYERAGFRRGRADAEAGKPLSAQPPTIEYHRGYPIQHSEGYLNAWLGGWAEGMGFDPAEFSGERPAT